MPDQPSSPGGGTDRGVRLATGFRDTERGLAIPEREPNAPPPDAASAPVGAWCPARPRPMKSPVRHRHTRHPRLRSRDGCRRPDPPRADARTGRASIVCEHGAQALALPRRSGSRRLFGQGARCSSIPKVMEPTCTLSLLGRKQDCVLQRSQPSARRRFAMLAQVLCPGRRHRHEHAASRRTMTRDEASVVGVLPHGKARTRRPPRLQHVGVGAGLGAHPLEQVEDQGVDGVGHRACCGLAQLGQLHRLVGHVDGAHDGGRGSTLRRFRCSRFSANRRSMRHCYGVST
jgi:hypothetical protein